MSGESYEDYLRGLSARDIARETLRVLASSGMPTTVRIRDKLWAQAEVDDEFEAELRSYREVRVARDEQNDRDMKWMTEMFERARRGV